VTIIRPPSVYGPRDAEIFHFFKFMSLGFNLTVGKIDQLINIVHVDDLAKGIVQAAFSKKSVGNIYFLCDKTPYKWSKIADMTAVILEKKYFTIRFPYFVAYGLSSFLELMSKLSGKATILNREKMNEIKEPYWVISSAKAEKDLSFQTDYSLAVGLRNTIEWYWDNSWLKSTQKTFK
jgi:nucleoside-diphosphate-sugar epimerase